MMSGENLHGLPCDLDRASRAGRASVAQKMADEMGDIVTPLAEGWEIDGNNIEPIVEVFPESAFLDPFFERFVGGGNDTHIDVNRDVITHPTHLAFLEDAQESALQHR